MGEAEEEGHHVISARATYQDGVPLASVTVRKPDAPLTSASPTCALLDTGSRWTYVSRHVADEQGLPADGEQPVGFIDGTSRRFKACLADVRIFHADVPSRVLILETDEAVVVIGRDVLNHFEVVFPGTGK